ncbi:MAG: OmpA family protein [Bacteroidales bacterium]|nr:OmpA family protein [Bacteroidales bacterium]
MLLLRVGVAVAQTPDNMVYNPSFEEHRRCPQRIDALGVMTAVDAWWQPTAGSSDYFNICGGRDCQVPRNKMGFQEAHSGDAYCGIYCSQEHYREYLQTELCRPLKAGCRYRVSFWVTLADKSPHAVASIGALLSVDRLEDTTWDVLMDREIIDYVEQSTQSIAVYLSPQIVNHPDSILDNTKEWTEVCGEFTAKGGERFLTIGNFAPFNKSNVHLTNSINGILQGAYYYIDDVSVVSIDESVSVVEQTSVPAQGEIIPMWNIFFATGQSEVLPQSYNELRRLQDMLTANPDMKIELRGHTDNQGTVEFNLRLSESRAKSVADYLVEHGIDRRRISSIGYGKSQPVDTNDTPEGRRRNRRVEYRVVSK